MNFSHQIYLVFVFTEFWETAIFHTSPGFLMAFILSLFSSSHSLFTVSLRIVPTAPISIGITVTFIFYNFLIS